MKELADLRWTPSWVSYLGCVKGCLDFLGTEASMPWLYGGTGYAFLINMHEEVCPSGPTAWNDSAVRKLGRNLGYRIDTVAGGETKTSTNELQAQAWSFVREAIDQGRPCFGWELEIPEFYLIYGYDDDGYYFSGPGCIQGKGPKRWEALGNSEIGFLAVMSVASHEKADDAQVVREALTFALDHGQPSSKWTFPHYTSGPKAFEVWAAALEGGRVDGGLGMWYNTAVWTACRLMAVEFLTGVRGRLGDGPRKHIDEAIAEYETVSAALAEVSKLYPPFVQPSDGVLRGTKAEKAAAALRRAFPHEQAGVEALGGILKALT